MQCREAVFAEDVLVYVLDNYRGEEYIREVYNPDCYIRLDDRQAIIYQQVQNVNGEAIQKYGFSAIPNVFGLMSEEALEASGVLRIRRQPSLDLYGQGVLIGIVDTGIDFTHKAFVAADGTSRIVSIWDQSVEEGVGNENFPYGRMYSREQLNQASSHNTPQRRYDRYQCIRKYEWIYGAVVVADAGKLVGGCHFTERGDNSRNPCGFRNPL